MRGRPAKTTAEHRRDGTEQPCRHADREDLVLADGSPERPQGLSEAGLKLWDRITSNLPEGAQAAIDTESLHGLCWWWGEFDRLRKAYDANPEKTRVDLLMVGAAWREFIGLAGRFGMSPADRTRIKVSPGGPKKSALDELLGRRSNN